jgi:hypothetical protein
VAQFRWSIYKVHGIQHGCRLEFQEYFFNKVPRLEVLSFEFQMQILFSKREREQGLAKFTLMGEKQGLRKICVPMFSLSSSMRENPHVIDRV